MPLLASVNNGLCVSNLNTEQLIELAGECRQYLIDCVLEHGGHFAGNLGVVELTVALMHALKPEDRIIWDVGHQSYVHKMLTGRLHQLKDIRTYGGISGFPKMDENPADAFGTGHSSTSVSAATGLSVADRLAGKPDKLTVAVVGDGALTGGQAFEALNNAAGSKANILIVVNDNHISIDPSTGAIDEHLQNISQTKENIFTLMGLPYTGPVDGHDMKALTLAIASVKGVSGPRILHVKTIKGKGYAPAELEQTRWHSTSRYVKIESGKAQTVRKWHEAAGDAIYRMAGTDSAVVGITPAMPSGSGLIRCFSDFPDRFFDVGIAEQHAVTFAAGLAAGGAKPILVIYSTFLQRGFDQVIHDIALQNLPVVIMVDRAGLVGEDGPTHHGAFDIAALQSIPNLRILAPFCEQELNDMLVFALSNPGPTVIRYPKGPVFTAETNGLADITELSNGSGTALVTCGKATELALNALPMMKVNPAVFHIPFVKPLPSDFKTILQHDFQNIITIEDGSIIGGFGMSVAGKLIEQGFSGEIKHLGIPDKFIPHGDNESLYKYCGYSPEDIAAAVNQS